MRSVNKNLIVLCSLLSIALTGCTYGPRPYGGGYGANPYGASPYGATYPGYQGGIQTLPPGQQFVPGGSVVPQGVSPGGTPTYQNNGGLNPIPSPGASTSAPPYSGSGSSNLVPEPSNPGGGPFYNNSGPTTNNSSPGTFVPPLKKNSIQPATHSKEPLPAFPNGLRESNASSSPTAAYSPEPIQSIPSPMGDAIDINKSNIPSMPLPISSPKFDDPFDAPAPAPTQPNPAAAAPAFPANSGIYKSQKIINDQAEPFAHHAKYEWIRGVVSKDEPTGTWSVVYSDNPKASDKFAGHISLASSPYLKNLKDGDVIEVKGEVDPVIKDPLGKSVYLVSHLNTITKAPTQESK